MQLAFSQQVGRRSYQPRPTPPHPAPPCLGGLGTYARQSEAGGDSTGGNNEMIYRWLKKKTPVRWQRKNVFVLVRSSPVVVQPSAVPLIRPPRKHPPPSSDRRASASGLTLLGRGEGQRCTENVQRKNGFISPPVLYIYIESLFCTGIYTVLWSSTKMGCRPQTFVFEKLNILVT